MTNFKPLNDLIMINVDKSSTLNYGMIVMANDNSKPTKGTVLAIGPGKYNDKSGLLEDIPVKPGDVVTFLPDSITEFKINNKVLSFIRASSLIGVEVN